MKLTYYKYFLEYQGNRYQNSILNMLQNFTSITSADVRNSFFAPAGDNLFLFRVRNSNIFLFVITKDDEIIKTISSNTLSHEDIYGKLSENERLGFASYIFVSSNYYGIASTFFGPKNSYWTNFVNSLLKRLGINNVAFSSEPFPIVASRQDVLNYGFKGQTYFQVNSDSPIYNQVLGLFGVENCEANTITIQIRPEPRGQMPTTVNAILSSITDEGLLKFVVKAKETMEDSLIDFYIVGTGHIHDSVRGKNEGEICNSIFNSVNRNTELSDEVARFSAEQTYRHDNIPIIDHFNDLDIWNSNIFSSSISR